MELAGLVFVVFIWPLGILCALSLLVLDIIGLVKLVRRRRSPRFGLALVIVAAVEALLYPVVAAMLASGVPHEPGALTAVSCAPVVLLALGGVVLGVLLRRA